MVINARKGKPQSVGNYAVHRAKDNIDTPRYIENTLSTKVGNRKEYIKQISIWTKHLSVNQVIFFSQLPIPEYYHVCQSLMQYNIIIVSSGWQYIMTDEMRKRWHKWVNSRILNKYSILVNNNTLKQNTSKDVLMVK